MLAVR